MVDITGTIAVLSSLLGIPLIVFGFIYMNGRGKREIELSRLRNEAARLELEKERVHLRRRFDKIDIGNFPDQRRDLGRQPLRSEIGRNPVAKAKRLPDVKDIASRVLHQINSRAGGKRFELFCNIHRKFKTFK